MGIGLTEHLGIAHTLSQGFWWSALNSISIEGSRGACAQDWSTLMYTCNSCEESGMV